MWPTKDGLTDILMKHIIGGKSLNDISDSFFVKHLIVALREAIWIFIEICEDVYKGQTVKYANGPNLDNLGYDFGVSRTEATKAEHYVTIKKSTPVLNDTTIPDNFLLTTTSNAGISPVKFLVMSDQDKTIPAGETEVRVKVECAEFGKIGNVDNGAINLVAQAGFDSVSDSKLFKKAVEVETDESYRERIWIRKRTPARAGVVADYERWAREIAGVSKSKAFRIPRGPGTVDVVIWGADGALPDNGLIESVQKHIDGVTPADIADGGILVCAPEEISIDIVIENVEVTADTVDSLKAVLTEYLASDKTALAITFVDLIVTINKVLDNFTLVEPSSDIKLSGRQAAILGSLEIR